MRKSVFILFFLVIIRETPAQEYMLSFTAMGDTNILSSVKVENITRGNSVTLNAGDTLHLKSSLGIISPDMAEKLIRLSPNPMKEHSFLTLIALEMENAVIRIVDLSGRTVYQANLVLFPGKHTLRISGIEAGIYFVNVSAKHFTHSIKLISQNHLKSRVEMETVSYDAYTRENHYKSTGSAIEMLYYTGDLLLFEGISGPFRAILTDIPANSKTITFNMLACHDFDGNNYSTTVIGNQTWMAENLKATHFTDGNGINLVQSNSEWENLSYTDKACCYYDNSLSNGNTFGALYTWAAAMNGAESSELNPSNVQGACPCGWHLPSDEEWIELEMFLGMSYEEAYGLGWRGTNEGNMLKTNFGWYSDGNGTNKSGFSALPAGSRVNGLFNGLSKTTCFWSSTEYFHLNHLAFNRSLSYLYSQVGWFSAAHYYGYPKNYGLSVRCVKD